MYNHDQLVLKVILNDVGKFRKGYKEKIKNNYPNIYNYILNRYPDSTCIHETIIRMKFNIEERPVCPVCGGSVFFIGRPNSHGIFSVHCSEKCSTLDKKVQEKMKKTNNKKYNCDWHTQSNNFKEKTKQTCLEKYGVEFANQSEIIKEKINNTKEIKYGSKTYNNMEKTKQTCLEKYGVDCWFKTKENHSQEFEERRIKTMKLNNSFGNRISVQEKEIYNKLLVIFPNIKTQYKSKLYPFNCDFYIPEIDTYIEFHGSQFHHFHPFDKNNPDDIKELERLKVENNKKQLEGKIKNQYSGMISTWTIRDVKKRTIAKKNNLNFLEFYTLDEFYIWYKKISN